MKAQIEQLKEENRKLKKDLEFVYGWKDQLEKENKTLREKLSEITMVADDEKQSIEHILELEYENKKLKEYNRRLKQGNDDLKEQNKKLKEELSKLKEKYGDLDY